MHVLLRSRIANERAHARRRRFARHHDSVGGLTNNFLQRWQRLHQLSCFSLLRRGSGKEGVIDLVQERIEVCRVGEGLDERPVFRQLVGQHAQFIERRYQQRIGAQRAQVTPIKNASEQLRLI